jgi:alkylation response protein AidB-like acyl-CoA dehydrogenase
MDYRFTPEEDAFRREVRTFLRAELPESWDYDSFELHDEQWEFARDFTKKLGAKRWLAPS